jgi:hypothetical protein
MENAIWNMLNDRIVVINLGLNQFAENLEVQDVEVVRVDWSPPAGGDQELIDLLDKLI